RGVRATEAVPWLPPGGGGPGPPDHGGRHAVGDVESARDRTVGFRGTYAAAALLASRPRSQCLRGLLLAGRRGDRRGRRPWQVPRCRFRPGRRAASDRGEATRGGAAG